MVPPASALMPTGYMPIDTVADARAVVTQCINGDLQLVTHDPDIREAAPFLWQNAVFVFEVMGQVSGPPAFFEEFEPRFSITDIPIDTRSNLRLKSITVVVNGRRYCVLVTCNSQNMANSNLQPRQENHRGHPDSQMLWPSELKLSEIHKPLETYTATLEATLQDMRGSKSGMKTTRRH
ncbi:hypothetical protein FVEG_16666 [Fusarium verticillioides 7600]|uniref:Uncharacterized protein n=1 Tax=Gibberella moniliformis (strain M3125 / FGSC 7600) TaxID=334819 RepID=W7MIC7_GIBM7|nr:hypothetical protein FVEG_16666 [Fusarium verticillioides 7600]EWG50636.1 hypothetical protein FVEG_16666 [Fusarium verticillioides 7600]